MNETKKEAENSSPVEAVVMCWKACNNWDDLPEGTWLVKINKDRKPYNIAEVSINNGNRLVIVGNFFSWDMGSIVAYTPFEPFNT